jgi:ribonuclease HI
MTEFVKKFSPEQKMLYEMRYTVFTDGSCDDTKRGGWAAIIQDTKGKRTILSGTATGATNNSMELTAILEALQWILNKYVENVRRHVQIALYSDSQYCVNALRDWMSAWEKTDFAVSQGGVLRPNADLLRELNAVAKSCKLSAKWVARNSCENSKKADEVCKEARQSI